MKVDLGFYLNTSQVVFGPRLIPIFQLSTSNGYFWMRIFGLGFAIKNIRKHPLLFSQRNDLVYGFRSWKYYFQFLGW